MEKAHLMTFEEEMEYDKKQTVHDRLERSKLAHFENENLYRDQRIGDLQEQIDKGKMSVSDLEDLYEKSTDPHFRNFLKSEISILEYHKDRENEKDQRIADYKHAFNEMTIPVLKALRKSLEEQSANLKSDPDYAYQIMALNLILDKKQRTEPSPERKFIANYEIKLNDFELFQTKLNDVLSGFKNKVLQLDDKKEGG